MNRKWLLRAAAAIVLSGVLLFFISDSWDREIREDKKVLAVSTIGPTHDWAADVMKYAKEELEKVGQEENWETMCVAAEDSYEQSQQIVELVKQQVDCIVMLPMDGASLKTAAVTVQSAGIPLVNFDREIPEFAPTATIKGDNRGIGVETARYFNNYFPQGTTVLELMGDTSTVPFQRTDGYDSTINENFTKIQVGYTEWQREYTKQLFTQWISQQDAGVLASVGAVFTHDDEIALGVLDVLDELDQQGKRDELFPELKVIAGSSSSQKMYQRIEKETKYDLFSMTYESKMMKTAVRTGAQILNGDGYEEMKIISTVMVNKSNVASYLEEG
ncbi:MAG: substrate-binding domain-containing protein [Lachnospiraceae bacterium]|nr:substrate-binding domain-containing protein [Lachnospiraceae bacterium]